VATSAEILHPDVAVITNVREHHVNEYGSIENVFEDKIKLVEFLTGCKNKEESPNKNKHAI
ncbi:MAG: hypothetical protein J6X35_11220, partial [Bacteroidales bacterium]|nr:hypothetical protein [Bacteroidales bacterium]